MLLKATPRFEEAPILQQPLWDQHHMMPNSSYRHARKIHLGTVVAPVLLLAFFAGCSSAATPNVTVGPTVQSASTSAASTAAAVATQAGPTAQAISTSGAPTVQAVGTAAAPTVQAIATAEVPTVQALATQAAPITATVTAAAPVRVVNVKVATQDSTVTLQDVGNQSVNLSNWSLQVGTARTLLPMGVDIQPGQTVTLHTASGTSNNNDVYLGQDAQAIASQLRPGVQITLENSAGGPVSSFVVPNG